MKNLYLFMAITFIVSNLQAQKLNKTDILQDDIYLYPLHVDPVSLKDETKKEFNRLRLRLLDIRAILSGDYNGDGY